MAVKLVIGSVPRGEDYFGRERFIEQLWACLGTDNVLLLAPRRFGKTGAMCQLLDAPRAPFQPLYMDVEHLESPADLIIELLAALRQSNLFAPIVNALWEGSKDFGRYLRGLVSQVDLGSLKVHMREETDVPVNWRAYGDRLMRLLVREDRRLLLLLDEFPIMVHHMSLRDPRELEQFMRWFRAVRVAPETTTRFLIGGSINLVPTLDAIGLVDTVNDLAIQHLPPFDAGTAERFVVDAMTANGVELPREVRGRIVAILGTPIPYLLSVLMTALLDRHRTSGAPITVEMVDDVFETELLGRTTPFFRHYYSRLQDYYPSDEARQAKAILGLLSRSDSAVTRDTLYQAYLRVTGLQPVANTAEQFHQLMQKLENDFYVLATAGGYEFSNRTIGLWWRNNYGFQTP